MFCVLSMNSEVQAISLTLDIDYNSSNEPCFNVVLLANFVT